MADICEERGRPLTKRDRQQREARYQPAYPGMRTMGLLDHKAVTTGKWMWPFLAHKMEPSTDL